ncbi:MAG TPA: hypothetical protein VND94_20795 [Terriglobia bacterium]|nr:hypothetical protein [Terriglobia bacterium]
MTRPQRSTETGQGRAVQKSLVSRLRLGPLVMIAVLATISVKANHLWHGLSVSFGRASEAQAANNQAGSNQAAGQPAQQPASPTGAPTQLGGGQSSQPPAAGTGQQPPAPAPAPQTAQVQPPPPAAQPANAPAPAGAPAPGGQGSGGGAGSPAGPEAVGGEGQGQDLLAQDQQRKLQRDPFNYTDEEVDVLQQLAKRRAELDQRARQLDEREALVKAAEQRMDQKMAELKALQATVQDLLKQRNAADEQQLQSLVKVYENMKPKAAAQIFEEMDMDVLLDVVSRMSERKVAPILALVSPTRAKELTFELAQRRQMPIPQ